MNIRDIIKEELKALLKESPELWKYIYNFRNTYVPKPITESLKKYTIKKPSQIKKGITIADKNDFASWEVLSIQKDGIIILGDKQTGAKSEEDFKSLQKNYWLTENSNMFYKRMDTGKRIMYYLYKADSSFWKKIGKPGSLYKDHQINKKGHALSGFTAHEFPNSTLQFGIGIKGGFQGPGTFRVTWWDNNNKEDFDVWDEGKMIEEFRKITKEIYKTFKKENK